MPAKLKPRQDQRSKLKTVRSIAPGAISSRRISIVQKTFGKEHTDALFVPERKDEDSTTDMGEDDWSQAKALVKPDDQLDLTEGELKEEFTRILTANNPHAPQNIVRYNYKEKTYKQISSVDQLAVHFALDGNLLHKESDEALRQTSKDAQAETIEEKPEQVEEQVETAQSEKTGDREDDTATPAPAAPQKLTNQFNFSERASQTYNNPYRERACATEPPPRVTLSGNVTQWEIFDAYQEDFEKKEKNKETKKKEPKQTEDRTKKKVAFIESQGEDLTKISNAAKIIERMVNQNTFDDVSQDFKYYEDPSDEFLDQEGTLLPLWKFSYEGTKKMAVTSICWNPRYKDLFCVGHGSYDFMKQSTGMLLFYSLKNPSFPEYKYVTESGIMSIDIHPIQPYLVVAGLYNGGIAVFNVTDSSPKPAFQSTSKSGKHTDPVWQVRWQKDDLDNHANFYSISSDGHVFSWTLLKNELERLEIVKLKLVDAMSEGPDHIKLETLGCGTCFDFHRQMDYLFLVGTEEGQVHKCSKAYANQFLFSYAAHHMAVYKIEWNWFHQDIFITCSADWSVKIWDHTYKDPLFTYDLGSSVGDVAWAPYSSTIFAAVTNDGKVFIFDLNVNKYEAICEQVVVQKKKTKLTHISFNPHYPVLVVGDDRGHIISMKLSPNLRKMPKVQQSLAEALQTEKKSSGGKAAGPEYELEKMNKLISLVRDTPSDNKVE